MSDGDEVATGTSPVSTAVPGDVNGDGSVDLMDAILCLKVLTGFADTAEINLTADLNGDGRIGLNELVLIIRHLAK